MNLHDIGNFGIVPFLCSTFLCINTYAQQSNLPVHYSRGESADSAGVLRTDPTDSASTMMKSYLEEQRDVFDILKMLFNIDITSSDTVSKEKGKLYVAAIPAVGYSLNTQFAITIGANAAIYVAGGERRLCEFGRSVLISDNRRV